MSLIADIFLAGGAIGVAVYCFVLSRRLTRFTDLERGVGGAVTVLSAQVDDLTKAMRAAQAAADESGKHLEALTERAEDVARRLELHVASLHDLDPSSRDGAPPAAPADAVREAVTAAPEAPAREEPQLRAVPTFRSAAAEAMRSTPAATARKVPSYFANRAAAPSK